MNSDTVSEETRLTFETISNPDNASLFTKEAALKAFAGIDSNNWPFPFINDKRTTESQALLDSKRYVSNVEQHRREDLSNMQEALF